jgi:hypothetical protein
VWCETLAFGDLPPLVPLLARYRVDLLLAVRPWQLGEVGAVVARARDAGVFVAVWPMLADADGRWASVATAAKLVAFGDELLARAGADEIILDLEPPLAQLKKWKDLRPAWTARSGYGAAKGTLVDAIARWQPRRVTTAVMPFLAAELAGEWMQRLLGTPVSELPVARHSVMAYTSLFEGWSRGLVGRRRAELLLAGTARLAQQRFGARAGLSLGTVGTGAFGDEPSYRDVAELARDVAIARRAGIAELSLFELGGIVRRAPAEAWLDALCADPL